MGNKQNIRVELSERQRGDDTKNCWSQGYRGGQQNPNWSEWLMMPCKVCFFYEFSVIFLNQGCCIENYKTRESRKKNVVR